ncbi:MAG: galactose-1-phosphate uridylyltransferase [Galactobacter sp.]
MPEQDQRARETRITRTHLADGRELIYFDDPGSPERVPSVDPRPLPPRPDTARLRFDQLSGEWISVATTRQNRAFLPPARLDPLAPQTPENPSEVPDHYDVAVFENKSPSFGPALPDPACEDVAAGAHPHEIFTSTLSGGRCEVVCFDPSSTGSFASQTTVRARTIVEAWAHRTRELSALPGIRQVFPFENRGVEIGVTLHHPHGQIYSYPYVPATMRRICESVDRYGPSLFADLVDAERQGPRVVLAGEHFTAYVPYAARWPVEVHLMPHRHIPDLDATTPNERDELAVITLRLTRALDAIYDAPLPYIGSWLQAPMGPERDTVRMSWRLTSPRRAADKLKYLAGSESGMGAWIADISPEDGAARLRDALAKADATTPTEPLHG